MIDAFNAGSGALRWVTDGAVVTDCGATWPGTRAADAPLADDLYGGTAGVLVALSEARLSGIGDFDDHARAAATRLRSLASVGAWAMANAAPDDWDDEPDSPDLGLYTGLSGGAAALHIWASVSGDRDAAEAALTATRSITDLTAAGRPVSSWRDVTSGEAGILLTLIDIGDAAVRPAISAIGDRLVAQAQWADDQPDWYPRANRQVFMPNFSHGAAGIGYALAAAGAAVDRSDLVDVAEAAGRYLVRLGSRSDGTLAVPPVVPPAEPAAPLSYGWCHGPTGTLRLFQQLERLRPGRGWAGHAEAARQAVRRSGLPQRLFPGFWDNLGQCCGTAGVGEMALDRYQQTGDIEWLEWAADLASDVLDRRIDDGAGIRWSNTEYRRDPPELEPDLGLMQGAAGIASWLLRLARVQREGVTAQRIRWPDRPPID
ncbi:MAG TPA: lanthionine synthetase LanC family protein [Streptosporangiaceae bacterium]|nr:lanthionine synthetase LanC family protein [Streptosporangiaceae bacterium]